MSSSDIGRWSALRIRSFRKFRKLTYRALVDATVIILIAQFVVPPQLLLAAPPPGQNSKDGKGSSASTPANLPAFPTGSEAPSVASSMADVMGGGFPGRISTATQASFNGIEADMAQFQSIVNSAGPGVRAPRAPNVFGITQQFRLRVEGDKVVRQTLLWGSNTGLERVRLDPNDSRIQFSANARTGAFTLEIPNEDGSIEAQVCEDLKTTSNIDSNPLLVAFATKEGLRFILWREIELTGFLAPLLAPVVYPLGQGDTITSIRILGRDRIPADVEAAYQLGGEVQITVENPGLGPDAKATKVLSFSDLIGNMGLQLETTVPMFQVLGGDSWGPITPVQRLSNMQVTIAQNFLHERTLEVSDDGNDLAEHALQGAFASKARQPGFVTWFTKLFAQDPEGLNAFQALAIEPRDVFTPEQNVESRAAIENGTRDDARLQQRYGERNYTPRNWRQKVADRLNGVTVEDLDRKAAKQRRSIAKKIGTSINYFYELATPERLKALSAAFLGVLATDYFTNGAASAAAQWTITTMANMSWWALHATTHVPFIKEFSLPLEKTLPFFKDTAKLPAWALGLTLVALYYPLSIMALGAGKPDWFSKSWEFLRKGVAAYQTGIYPLQKAVWERILGQRLLYHAMENGINPYTTRLAWNSPFAGPAAVEQRRQALDDLENRRTAAKIKTRMIGAAFVAWKTEQEYRARNGGAATKPIDILSMLIGYGLGPNEMDELLRRVKDPTFMAKFERDVYEALMDLGDNPETLTWDDLETQINLGFGVAERIKTARETKSGFGRALDTALTATRQRVNALYSESILPLAMGLTMAPGRYEEFVRARRVHMDAETVRISDELYRVDYLASAGVLGVTMPHEFVQIITLGAGGVEILANQGAQTIAYSIIIYVDVSTTESNDARAAFTRLVNPAPPIQNELLAGQLDRTQTISEGLGAIMRGMRSGAVDNWTGQNRSGVAGYLEVQEAWMRNTITGMQMRFTIEYIVRLLGLTIQSASTGALIAHAWGPAGALAGIMGDAIPLTLFYLLAKISLQWSPENGVAIGYAMVWPIVTLFNRHMKADAARNRARIQTANGNLYGGITAITAASAESPEYQQGMRMVLRAVAEFKRMYAEEGVLLPLRFDKPNEEFTLDDFEAFAHYTLVNVALATKDSQFLNLFFTLGIGVLGSAILTSGPLKASFNREGAWGRLAASGGFFLATWATVKVARNAPTEVRMLTAFGKKLCREALAKEWQVLNPLPILATPPRALPINAGF